MMNNLLSHLDVNDSRGNGDAVDASLGRSSAPGPVYKWLGVEWKPVVRLYSLLHTMAFTRALAVTVVFLTALANAATYTGKVQLINGEGNSNGFLKNWNSGL